MDGSAVVALVLFIGLFLGWAMLARPLLYETARFVGIDRVLHLEDPYQKDYEVLNGYGFDGPDSVPSDGDGGLGLGGVVSVGPDGNSSKSLDTVVPLRCYIGGTWQDCPWEGQ